MCTTFDTAEWLRPAGPMLPTPRKKLDNECVDDAAFIEETQDTDVAEIIGDEPEPGE